MMIKSNIPFFILSLIIGCNDGGKGDGENQVCTFGMDQTCNDYDWVSSLWGECLDDGTCSCKDGFVINPATGRCRPESTDGGAGDGGVVQCGEADCLGDQFCVERVHDNDTGGAYSTWECNMFRDCAKRDCACAIQSFVSASCTNPVCTSDSPFRLKCDDLN